MTNKFTPKTRRVRNYNVTGNVLAANTPQSHAGQRIEGDFQVSVSHVIDNDEHYLVFTLGSITIHELNEPAKLVFKQKQVATVLNNIYDHDEVTTDVHGQVYRSADPIPDQFESDIPVTVSTISTPETDTDGVVISAGEDEQEGGRIEFSPQQSRDLKAVFKQFVAETLSDPNTGMQSLHVDETGSFKNLDS